MKYRVVKKKSWWSSIFDTGTPQFLYYDFDLESFEVAGYKVAREYKWEFDEEEIASLRMNEGFDSEFFVENVRQKGDNI